MSRNNFLLLITWKCIPDFIIKIRKNRRDIQGVAYKSCPKFKISSTSWESSRNPIEPIFFLKWSLDDRESALILKIGFVDVSGFRFVDESAKWGFFGCMPYDTSNQGKITSGFTIWGQKFNIDHPWTLSDHLPTTKRPNYSQPQRKATWTWKIGFSDPLHPNLSSKTINWPPLPTFWPLVDHKKPKMDLASKERNLNMKNMVFEPTESKFLAEKSIIDHPCPPNWPLVDQKTQKFSNRRKRLIVQITMELLLTHQIRIWCQKL